MTDSNNYVLKRIGTYDMTGNRLGKGNFAYVELATNRVTKTKVAMKVIDTRKIRDDYVNKNLLREAVLLKRVSHPNIVRLYETLKQHSIYCIVTEFVPGGELLSYLRSQNDSKLSESQARPIMRQLISALYHMHEQGIVHRDLKMENILLDENRKNIKIVGREISDFGLSNICQGDNLLKTQCGSPEYAAPELFRRGCKYGAEVDLWSLGVIMYGIVVGRLPFRSPHFGGKGRNELIEQTSRGLSSTHNKYLCLLTPQCRDLLRKLLEPRPELRLPLLDVMVHPWVTVQGTAPLVPYSEPPIDEKIKDKVFEKASQLIKISKSQIAFHVQQKRYDAVAAVYNLLLDEELKRAYMLNSGKTKVTQHSQKDSVIRVSIKSVVSDREETERKNGNQDLSCSKDWEAQPKIGQDCDGEQDSTRKQNAQKPNLSSVEIKLEGLWIKGHNICGNEGRYPKTRPNTATPNRTSVENPSKPNGVASRAWNRRGRTRCKSCIPRFAPKFESNLQGKRMVMSPRVRQAPETMTSQFETKLEPKVAENEEEGSKDSEEYVKMNVNSDEESAAEKVPVNDPTEKSNTERHEDIIKENAGSALERMDPKDCYLRDAPGIKETPEMAKFEGNKPGQSSQASSKLVTSRGAVWSLKGMPPSSLATQTGNRAVSPLKTSQFVDLADYHKYVPQPPKARTTGLLGDGSRLVVKEGESEEHLDSFSAAYQYCLKNIKPHHQRLSIMQAQEILHHEFKFHAKYGRRLSTENNISNTDSMKQHENQVSRFSHASNVKPSDVTMPKKTIEQQQCAIPKPSYVKGVSLHMKDKKEMLIPSYNQEDNDEKQSVPGQGCRSGSNPTVDRRFHEDNPQKPTESRLHANEADGIRQPQANLNIIRLNQAQEESLRRQKEKEQTEDREREKLKFLKKLEDQERQKIITQYLQEVYSQYGQQDSSHSTIKATTPNSRTFKVSKNGRVYSVVTHPAEKLRSAGVTRVTVTKPMPIVHSAARGSQGEKKLVFRPQPDLKGDNGVRFVNEWNNNLFTEYINSSDGDIAAGKENDKLNTKDPSFWLEQHLNGILDETTVTKPDLHDFQQLIPRET